MSGRFYDPNPTYFDLLSNQPVAGGFLAFYLQGTTTPKLTWSDQALTIPNTNPVPLDSSGRANVNIWLSGAYTVVLRDSLGAVIWTRDVSDGAAGGLTIPTPLPSGQFLTNDGSILSWASILQPPDPTGSDGYYLTANGGAYVLAAPPTIPTPNYSFGDNFTKIGTNLDQWGTGSIPASAAQIATGNITFPVPYLTVPNLQVTINKGSGVVSAGYIGDIGVSAVSTTGATIAWDLGIDDTRSQYNLTSPIPIMWRAVGKVAA